MRRTFLAGRHAEFARRARSIVEEHMTKVWRGRGQLGVEVGGCADRRRRVETQCEDCRLRDCQIVILNSHIFFVNRNNSIS